MHFLLKIVSTDDVSIRMQSIMSPRRSVNDYAWWKMRDSQRIFRQRIFRQLLKDRLNLTEVLGKELYAERIVSTQR